MTDTTDKTGSMTRVPSADGPTLVEGPAGATERRHVDSEAVTQAFPMSRRVRATPDEGPPAAGGPAPYDDRYEIVELIGEGGMGEVYACVDRRIGREIALKRLRTERGRRPEQRERFLREGRVQGQLEHPSIVPVYEIAQDPDGAAYVTMKRVRGETLGEVLDRLQAEPASERSPFARRFSRHKLLTAFASVCLAVHYAHASGVIHRDLKPSNVMLGPFGEVYVLDWGIAKLATAGEREGARASEPPLPRITPSAAGTPTEAGVVLGTPGYMAPEQYAGRADGIDARADVYALGAILFEILTLEPLHPHGATAVDTMKQTLAGVDARASVRAPMRDVEPELDAICVKATAVDPGARYATALDLHDAVEAVLGGYRDVQRRRELAAEHARAAADAATRSRAEGTTAARAVEETRKAMREISRAVALDPENPDTLRTLVELFTRAPTHVPREATRELASVHAHSQRVGARTAALAYLSVIAYAPFALWMGVHDLVLVPRRRGSDWFHAASLADGRAVTLG